MVFSTRVGFVLAVADESRVGRLVARVSEYGRVVGGWWIIGGGKRGVIFMSQCKCFPLWRSWFIFYVCCYSSWSRFSTIALTASMLRNG